jgi:hypothetical protein
MGNGASSNCGDITNEYRHGEGEYNAGGKSKRKKENGGDYATLRSRKYHLYIKPQETQQGNTSELRPLNLGPPCGVDHGQLVIGPHSIIRII